MSVKKEFKEVADLALMVLVVSLFILNANGFFERQEKVFKDPDSTASKIFPSQHDSVMPARRDTLVLDSIPHDIANIKYGANRAMMATRQKTR